MITVGTGIVTTMLHKTEERLQAQRGFTVIQGVDIHNNKEATTFTLVQLTVTKPTTAEDKEEEVSENSLDTSSDSDSAREREEEEEEEENKKHHHHHHKKKKKKKHHHHHHHHHYTPPPPPKFYNVKQTTPFYILSATGGFNTFVMSKNCIMEEKITTLDRHNGQLIEVTLNIHKEIIAAIEIMSKEHYMSIPTKTQILLKQKKGSNYIAIIDEEDGDCNERYGVIKNGSVYLYQNGHRMDTQQELMACVNYIQL